MRRQISIAEIQRAGVTIKPEEAVAIAQQLMARNPITSAPRTSRPGPMDLCRREALHRQSFGPPTPANVFIEGDGSASCTGCDGPLAVSEIATLLQRMLPLETSHVAGSLRYTIARALLEVDAPPFDSLDEFSEVLARYERGDRAAQICRLLERTRVALARWPEREPPLDRRRMPAQVFELQRELRESDARLYDQQLAIDALCQFARPPQKPVRNVAVAAGLAIGLILVGAGELMRPDRDAFTRAPVSSEQAGRDGFSRAPDTEPDSFSRAPETSSKPVSPAIPPVGQSAPRAERTHSGLLDRLHLRWLHGKVVIRVDDL